MCGVQTKCSVGGSEKCEQLIKFLFFFSFSFDLCTTGKRACNGCAQLKHKIPAVIIQPFFLCQNIKWIYMKHLHCRVSCWSFYNVYHKIVSCYLLDDDRISEITIGNHFSAAFNYWPDTTSTPPAACIKTHLFIFVVRIALSRSEFCGSNEWIQFIYLFSI